MKHAHIQAIAIASAAGLGAGAAEAAVYNVTLTQFGLYSNSGLSNSNVTSSTATWSYDDVTNLVTQTGGTFNARFTTSPSNTLFRYTATGLVVGNGSPAAATTYACLEGNFGGGVGASICGNYTFGANFSNQSTTSWGPGTATSRTLGGDDAALGPTQSIAAYDGMNTVSWNGSVLTVSNRSCTFPGGCIFSTSYNAGMIMNFVVPVPAAAWLFGPAVGALGLLRRRPVRRDLPA